MLPISEYSRFAVSLFASLNPVAAVPIFLSQTRGLSAEQTSRAAIVAAGTAAAILVAVALTGQSILPMLGAWLGALQIAGGLAMLLMALPQLNLWRVRDDARAAQFRAAAVVPIGFPLLAGPVSITSVIVGMRHGSGIAHIALEISCVVTTCAAVWLVLRTAQSIESRIGQRGLNAFNRLFGLLVAAIAVEIICTGFRSLFPILR